MGQTYPNRYAADLARMTEEVNKRINEAISQIKWMEFSYRDDIADTDPVHNPSHYIIPGTGLEVIDVIQGIPSPEEFKGYCYGNIIKYILRAPNKGGTEDFKKAQVYLEWLLVELSDEEEPEQDL